MASFSHAENIICALGLKLELRLELELRLGLELAEIRFWSNVFSSKCS